MTNEQQIASTLEKQAKSLTILHEALSVICVSTTTDARQIAHEALEGFARIWIDKEGVEK